MSPVAVLPERPGIVSYQAQAGGRGGGRLFFCPLRHSFLSSSVSVTSNPPRRIMLCSWIKLDNCPSLKPGATHGPRGASGVPPGGGVTCAEPHLCRVPQSRNREARRAAPPGPIATPRGRSPAASLRHFHSHFNQKDSSRPSPGLGLCAVSPAVPRPLTSSPGRCPSRFPWGPVASAPPCACVTPVHTSTVRASRSQTAESRAFLLCPVSQGEAGAGEAGVCHDVLAHRCHRRKVQSRDDWRGEVGGGGRASGSSASKAALLVTAAGDTRVGACGWGVTHFSVDEDVESEGAVPGPPPRSS